jgi:phospholipase/carboxylesterase
METPTLDLQGPTLATLSCGKAVYLVVLLHGYGANGQDLIDMAVNWQPGMIKAEFMSLNAPYPCENGGPGRQWFSLLDRSPEAVLPQLRESAEILNNFLDRELDKRHLNDSHLALIGFSQGAMMALHVGLRRRKKIGAIVAISGRLLAEELLPAEIKSKPPVLLIHGDQDDVVLYENMGKAKAALKALDVPVKSLTRKGLGHAIDDDSVLVIGDYIVDQMVPKKKAGDDHDDHDHDHADGHDHAHEEHDHEH